MIEEFDAIQSLDISRAILTSVGFLLVGIIFEVILRIGKRWTLSKNLTWLPAILGALTWLPLFWGVLLGTVWPLLKLLEEQTGWPRGPELMNALLLISVTIVIVRLINGLLRILTARTTSASVSLLNNLVLGVGLLVIVAIILGYLFNISFVVLLLAIVGGITGLTVVFQKPLNNLVAGVSLTVSNRLTPGDWIRLPSGIEGQVTDIQWDTTVVKQLSNNVIIVPNDGMTDAEIINFSRPEAELRFPVAVGVSYNSDLARVEQVTLEEAHKVMRQFNGDTPTSDPVIRYNTFADSSINFDVLLRVVRYDNQVPLRHEFIKQLHQRYDKEGINIPFPIRTLHTHPDQPVALRQATEAKQ